MFASNVANVSFEVKVAFVLQVLSGDGNSKFVVGLVLVAVACLDPPCRRVSVNKQHTSPSIDIHILHTPT